MLTQLSQFKHTFLALPRYLRVLVYLTAVYLSYVCTLGLILPYAITTLAPENYQLYSAVPSPSGISASIPLISKSQSTNWPLKKKTKNRLQA